MKLHGYRFAIDTKPLCVWTWDLRAESLRAVKRLDPVYFRCIAETHQAELSGPDHHRAALALRTGQRNVSVGSRSPDLFKLGVEFPIPEDAIKAFTPAEILAVYDH